MSDNVVQEGKGIFTFHITSNDTKVSIGNSIPKQVLTLKNVRLEMTTSAQALAQKIAYVDVPWLATQQLIDNQANQYNLPILLKNEIVSFYETDIPVSLTRPIEEQFAVRVLNSAGQLMPNFVSLTLQFTYNKSQIV